MKLTVKGKDLDLGESLQDRVRETLERISQRYFHDPVDATVSFGRQAHHRFSAHISVHVGRNISGEADGTGRSAYEALFNAGEAVGKQLRRMKRRLRHHPRHDPEFMLDRPDPEEHETAPVEPIKSNRASRPRRIEPPREAIADFMVEAELPIRRVAGRR